MAEYSASAGVGYSLFKDLWLYIKNKVKYIKDSENNFAGLKYSFKLLRAAKADIDKTVAASVSNEKNNKCKALLEEIEYYEKRYEELSTRYLNAYGLASNHHISQASDEQPNGSVPTINEDAPAIPEDAIQNSRTAKPSVWTPKFFKMAKLSKEVVKLNQGVSGLINQLQRNNLTAEKAPDVVELKHAANLDCTPSLNEHVKKLQGYLEDENTKRILLKGPPGVGKTAILENLNDSYSTQSPSTSDHPSTVKFDFVIWVTVQNDADGEIQEEIMRRLKLMSTEERINRLSVQQNASRISKALEAKRYLLLIDQVSSPIHLNKIGIHFDHIHGKVVVASTSRLAFSEMADPFQLVKVEKLPAGDAWNLFKKILGRDLPQPTFKDLADQILKELGGIPEAIKGMATYLRDTDSQDEWEGVKVSLQSNNKSELLGLAGVQHTYTILYNKIEEEDTKKCLLYVALFQNYKIHKDYLIECWIGEGFVPPFRTQTENQAFKAARSLGHVKLSKLTSCYLLDKCFDEDHVMMPRNFRRVVSSLKDPDGGILLVKAGEEIDEPAVEDDWKDAKRISLMDSQKRMFLPEIPHCVSLSTLILKWNPGLTSIGNLFFIHMPKLRVLDLGSAGINSLPSSIYYLENLRNLYLKDCSLLEKLPLEIANLKKLEVLDVRGTAMCSLPTNIYALNGKT